MNHEITDYVEVLPERVEPQTPDEPANTHYVERVLLPLLLLAVSLFGGMRFAALDSAFIFIAPPLAAVILAALTLALFVQSGTIDIRGWFDKRRPFLENASNAAIVALLFLATAQVYNSLLPERGVTFWMIGLFFVWTLWTNLFAELNAAKTIRSLGAVIGLAFVVKYVVLANLAGSPEGGFFERWWRDPTGEAAAWMLDLPRYAAATGYVQFFVLTGYIWGLYIMPRSMFERSNVSTSKR
jgi:hypothetical protein